MDISFVIGPTFFFAFGILSYSLLIILCFYVNSALTCLHTKTEVQIKTEVSQTRKCTLNKVRAYIQAYFIGSCLKNMGLFAQYFQSLLVNYE